MKLFLILSLCVLIALSRTTWDQLDNYTFEQYKQEFNKVYSSPNEELKRRKMFETRLEKIKKHNSDPTKTWKEGVNHLTDRSQEEFKKRNGYVKRFWRQSPHRETGYNMHLLKRTPKGVKLPDNFDWRTKNVLTAVKDQGECGSCWTFASTESIESAYAIKYGAGLVTDLSEQQVLDCTPNPDQCGGTGGCQGGTAELVYANMIKMGGMTTEWYYPYISYYGQNFQCHFNASTTIPYAKLSNYTKLPSNQYDPLIEALVNHGPVAISVMASTWSDYESGVYAGCPKTNIDIDHAVLLVGYGVDPAYGNYWLIRNSWSPKWGEDGYIRVRRDVGTQPCGTDYNPQDGTGCKNGPPTVTTCGECGMLYDSSFPLIQ